jgi:hypothetical protein
MMHVLLLLIAQSMMTGLDGGDGISFEAVNAFADLPPFGFSAIELTVKNDSDRSHVWTVRTRAARGWGTRDIFTSERTVEVPQRSESKLEILAPLPTVGAQPTHVDLSLTVEGYGVRSGQAYLATRAPNYYEGLRPTVGLSARLEAKDPDRFVGSSAPVAVLKFSPVSMPADWRAMAGLDAIWMTPEDLADLSDTGRAALFDWVMQGGTLSVCALEEKPIAVDLGRYGLGAVERMAWDGVGITDAVNQAAASLPRRDALTRERGTFHSKISHQLINRPLMLSFLLGFGILIGPINLFWFARAPRRARLLWTTPLISVAASVLLATMILLQDGVGGSGQRYAATLLSPDRSREVVFQEQISRTGMLLSSTFPTVEGAFIEQIGLGDGFRNQNFGLARERHTGDWFSTRTVQAQRIEAVRPSRSRIEFLGLDADRPRIASTLPVALGRLVFYDQGGAIWTLAGLAPGEQATLERSDQSMADRFFEDALRPATPFLQALISRRRGTGEWFFARTVDPVRIDTLRSIRWEDEPSLYFGPVEARR